MLGSMFSMVKPRLDDLGTDRLNYYYSTLIIMGMSLTITARQYVGSPLQCWVPAQVCYVSDDAINLNIVGSCAQTMYMFRILSCQETS